jgi:hypothetical protein
MSYALSFAERFFIDDDPEKIRPSERPTTVYQSIISLSRDAWRHIAFEVFNVPVDRLTPGTVLDKVIETNTCSNLDEPVEVWIDSEGNHSLRVFGSGSIDSTPVITSSF